jgi:hypothetical protein
MSPCIVYSIDSMYELVVVHVPLKIRLRTTALEFMFVISASVISKPYRLGIKTLTVLVGES